MFHVWLEHQLCLFFTVVWFCWKHFFSSSIAYVGRQCQKRFSTLDKQITVITIFFFTDSELCWQISSLVSCLQCTKELLHIDRWNTVDDCCNLTVSVLGTHELFHSLSTDVWARSLPHCPGIERQVGVIWITRPEEQRFL